MSNVRDRKPGIKEVLPRMWHQTAFNPPRCHLENLPGDILSGDCGQDLTQPKETTALNYSEPRFYTPKFLVNKVLASKSDLEGERKQVTVLLADLKDSMVLMVDRNPEEARIYLIWRLSGC